MLSRYFFINTLLMKSAASGQREGGAAHLVHGGDGGSGAWTGDGNGGGAGGEVQAGRRIHTGS